MAQNEMTAMRGMPLRAPSMEGLGRIVERGRNASIHARYWTETEDVKPFTVPYRFAGGHPKTRRRRHREPLRR